MRAAVASLARHRARARSRMNSRCAVMRKIGFALDEDGFKVPEWATVHVDLPTRVHSDPKAAASRAEDVAGAKTDSARRVESFPFGTDDLADGDLVEITSGDCVDKVFRLVEATAADQQTACRFEVIETTRPTEWG